MTVAFWSSRQHHVFDHFSNFRTDKGVGTMARGKAITTHARELSKILTPEQMRELSQHLITEADKPRLDKKVYAKARRDVQAAFIKLQTVEERLTELLTDAGKSNSEINEEIKDLQRTAERRSVVPPTDANAAPTTRGRRKQNPPA
jgi:hypothetical protein